MEIKVTKSGFIEIAEITGRVDATNSPELEAVLTSIIDAGTTRILLDLNGLSYISSSGLRVFLLVAKKLEKKGKISFCQLQSQVEQILTISGFNTIFPIYPTREEGIAYLSKF